MNFFSQRVMSTGTGYYADRQTQYGLDAKKKRVARRPNPNPLKEARRAEGPLRSRGEDEDLPPEERLDVHGFDVGAEHGSGWSARVLNLQPEASETELNTEGDPVVRDAGEVNRVQIERIKDLMLPLPANGVQTLPVTLQANSAPTFKSADPADQSIHWNVGFTRLAEQPSPKPLVLDEGQKMGLLPTSTEVDYLQTAMQIRQRDRYVTDFAVYPEMMYSPAQAQSVVSIFNSGSRGERPLDVQKILPNPLIARGQTYDAMGFSPFVASERDPEEQMVGAVGSTFTSRRDSYAGNELEKLVVINPLATQNALDKAVFTPQFRDFGEFPAAVRQYMMPYRS